MSEYHKIQSIYKRDMANGKKLIGRGSLHDAVEIVKKGFLSMWGNFEAEGIVARPVVELLSRGGQRIIAKIKCRDFA